VAIPDLERRLALLVGLPLWGICRASTMQTFQFGPRRVVTQRRGRNARAEQEVGAHALHVHCDWRIHSASALVVEAHDRYDVMDGGHSWDRPGANRCDQRVVAFEHACCPCIVRDVRMYAHGALALQLEHGHVLEVAADVASRDEQWRVFSPYEPTPHVVFRSGHLEEE
jgi:hypothetical protein